MSLRIEQAEDIQKLIETTDLDVLSYDRQWKLYRFRLKKEDLEKNIEVIKQLMKKAFEEYPM